MNTEIPQQPELPRVDALAADEVITQILAFGRDSLALLTSSSRVLVPGKNFGEWHELPVPPRLEH